MQKEVLLAVVVGFVVGILLTFGIWQANQAIRKSTLVSPALTEEIESSPAPLTTKPRLTIISPSNELLTSETKVSLKGSFSSDSQIAIIFEGSEKIVETDGDGNFETEIELVAGENLIQIIGINNDDEEDRETLMIVHSTAEI